MKTDIKSGTRNNKGLQKLTESENKINSVLALKKVTPEDVKHLSQEEKNKLGEILTHRINTLTGNEREKLCTQVEEIMDPQTKNELWENNHISIMLGISALIKEYGRMPSKTEIASKTKISRQTIHKHLKEYKNNPYYLEFQEQFQILSPRIMTTVFQYAVNGDMRAARLYFECIGALKNTSFINNLNSNTLIQNQNNYIQINGKVLSQETIKHLNPEQLNTIEGILKTIEVKNDE